VWEDGAVSIRSIAVIPARGGSKRIPRKNLRYFRGKPILAYAVELARSAGCFDEIVITSDDAEIRQVALDCGATFAVLRAETLADDLTPLVPVVADAVREVSRQLDSRFQLACCLYATAPMASASDLLEGLRVMTTQRCDYALSVAAFPAPIERSFLRQDSGFIEMRSPDEYTTRSQDLPVTYFDAGQWCWGTTESWLDEKPMLGADSQGVVVPSWRVCDIDTLEDWRRAELLAELVASSEQIGT